MQHQRQLTQWVKVTIPGLEETQKWQQLVITFEPGTLNPEPLSLGMDHILISLISYSS